MYIIFTLVINDQCDPQDNDTSTMACPWKSKPPVSSPESFCPDHRSLKHLLVIAMVTFSEQKSTFRKKQENTHLTYGAYLPSFAGQDAIFIIITMTLTRIPGAAVNKHFCFSYTFTFIIITMTRIPGAVVNVHFAEVVERRILFNFIAPHCFARVETLPFNRIVFVF